MELNSSRFNSTRFGSILIVVLLKAWQDNIAQRPAVEQTTALRLGYHEMPRKLLRRPDDVFTIAAQRLAG